MGADSEKDKMWIVALEGKVRELERQKAEQEAIVFGVGDIICGNGVKHKQPAEDYVCLYCIIDKLHEVLFTEIQKHCKHRMNVSDNCECSERRKLISGLGGCLCKAENCHELKALQGKEAKDDYNL